MCLSHLIHTVRPCLIHTCHVAPMASPTMPLFSRPRHSTDVERRPMSYLLGFGFFRLRRWVPRSCYQTHTNLRRRWQVWNQTPLAWTRKIVVAAHYKKDDMLHCWNISSDISGYHADIHEGHATVGAGQGRGMAVWINARHGRGMLCVNRP